jgi:disulfide bond formation protein DsbB
LAFTGGLLAVGSGKQAGLLVFGLLHLFMLPCALVLQRRVFLVFGSIGIFVFLATEATRFFRNSLGFSIALTLIGVAMIAAGIVYKRHEVRLSAALLKLLPTRIVHHHARAAGPALAEEPTV